MIKKIFGFLIVTAVCVVIGTFILNKGLPNAITQTINTMEKGIKAGTSISFDLNGDGIGTTQLKTADAAADKAKDGVGVEGLDGLH